MGCCGPSYPRNREIDAAKTAEDLINALKNIQKKNNEEAESINNHVDNGAELTEEFLKGFNDDQLKERAKYLNTLNESADKLIENLGNSSKALPISDAKELLQNWYGHYFVCYDQTNQYMNDQKEFEKFALKYDKSAQN